MMKLSNFKKLVFVAMVALLVLPVVGCAPKAPPPPPPPPPAGTLTVNPAKIDVAMLKPLMPTVATAVLKLPAAAAPGLPPALGILVLPVKFKGSGWQPKEIVTVELVVPPDVEMKGLDRARGEDSVGIAFATTDDKGNFEVALESVSKIDWVLRAGFTPSLAPDAKTLIPGNPLPNGTYTLRAVGEDTRAVATTTWVLELVAPPAPPPAAPPAAAPGAPPAAPPAAGKLSFEAAEYTNAELGFSVKYPKDWAKGELKYGPTVVYVAAAAAQVPVISVNIEEGAKFADAVALAVDRFGSKVKVSPEKETTLADGTKAYTAFVTYEPDIAPLEAKCFALGVQKGTKWVIVTVSTVDMLYTYNEAKFSEIVNTLQFKK